MPGMCVPSFIGVTQVMLSVDSNRMGNLKSKWQAVYDNVDLHVHVY